MTWALPQVTAQSGAAVVELLQFSKRITKHTSTDISSTAAAAGGVAEAPAATQAAERPVKSLLDYAAWALSVAGGSASSARLVEELSSVGEAARRLQVCEGPLIKPATYCAI